MDAADVLGGRYRLVERLGEGGMSIVWRAWDDVLDRHVAVKLLSPRLAADPTSRRRIRVEARAAARLAHPNIAGVFDYGESPDADGVAVPYIVMELVVGRTLAEILEGGPLRVHEVLRLCAQVAAGLAAAHEQGIVHRDVKPANVMVVADGTAKVVDFGVAGVIGDLGDQGAALFGTPAYVAPERLSDGAVQAGTDVYGLGVLLYRMLTGSMPWPAETTTQMLAAHMYVEPGPLPTLDGVPDAVSRICRAALSKEPRRRPSSAEIAAVLAAASTALSGPAAVVSASDRAAAPRGRRTRQLAVAGAALAVLVAAAAFAAANAGSGRTRADGPVAADGPTGSGPTGTPSVIDIGVGGPPTTDGPGASPPTARPGAVPPPAMAPPGGVTPRGPGAPPAAAPTSVTTAGGDRPATGPTTPAWAERSAAQYGNNVTVRCSGAAAQITAARPAAGWSVTRLNPGPADQVNVRFESAGTAPHRVTFKSRCRDGIPRINPDTGA